MTALASRLLADDELLNRLFAESNNFALREDVRALMAEAHNAIVEAAAALSVPESLEAVTQLEWSATLCDGKNVDYATAEKACAALGEGGLMFSRHKLRGNWITWSFGRKWWLRIGRVILRAEYQRRTSP